MQGQGSELVQIAGAMRRNALRFRDKPAYVMGDVRLTWRQADQASDRLALKDFPPGTAGTGLQMTAIDIDRDGDLDLLCPGKSGLYLFENLARTH